MLADHAEEIDLQFPAFSDQAKQELTTLLPPLPPCQIRWTTQRQFGVNRKNLPRFCDSHRDAKRRCRSPCPRLSR